MDKNGTQENETLAALGVFIDSRIAAKLRELNALRQSLTPRALRVQRGFTVHELAMRAGLSPAVISKIETGRAKRPAVATLNSVARALGISERDYRTAFATQRL